ncbi:hypothetical protein [Shewanella morhuae]|uniref:Uncharacterized protein n=1 Tax=Shewanella morhuae TaxID=365591 RepID=A0A380ANS2_9GAMM|nr:hypothetical protein [Shewanella morhuae]SUI83802.1 Uncharacterised protein [Shewanella morhuae]
MRLTFITVAIMLVSAQANASIEQQLSQCADTADKLERLICFDKLAASVQESALTSPSIQEAPAAVATVVATTAVVTTIPKVSATDNFGMEAKRINENTVDKIYLEVQSRVEDAYGAIEVTFTNGQVWKQTDSRKFTLKPGDTVYIEKAALGSFLLGTDDRNAKARVKRLK